MTKGWKLYWLLVVATLAVYFAMVLWSLPAVSLAAGGLMPFDMRPSGYSFDEALAFVIAITPEGSSFYQNTQQLLDTTYPAMLATVLAIALWNLARRFPTWMRWLLVALPVVGSLADYLENAAVSRMLDAGASGLTADMVSAASRWTLIKSGMTGVGMLVLLGLLIGLAARKLFKGKLT